MKFDYGIIGAGIVGLATAIRLNMRYPDASITIIDKESEPAAHQTGHNSGVLHSGIYYTPGSLKAKNCMRGYGMMLEFCREQDIAHEIIGKMIVATTPEELPHLERIYSNGIKNGLKDLEWMDSAAIREKETLIRGVKAIWVPQAGIVDYRQVAARMYQLLESRGVAFYFGQKVTGVHESAAAVRLEMPEQQLECKQLIATAGLHADRLARSSDSKADCQIVPFRGEYYQFKGTLSAPVNHLVYPVPNPEFPFLGVHFTPTVYGTVEAGPNAVLAFAREGYRMSDINLGDLAEILRYPGFQRLARKHFRQGMAELYRSLSKRAFVKELAKLMPGIQVKDLEVAPAGVRAQALKRNGELVDDFHIIQRERILHLINAPSPAATASFSIGEYIVNLL